MLRQAVDDYVELRRATGFKFRDGEEMLRSFARFAAKRGEDIIRAETALAWAGQAERPHRRHMRLGVVSRFAAFLRSEDPRHEIPPPDVFPGQAVRPLPYVFSAADIAQILACAAQLSPEGSLRPLTYSTLFGLIAVAGLRIREALELRIGDFRDAGLVIRETKFRKSRFLPLHETTLAALEHYLIARRKVAGQTDHLFVSLHRRKLSAHVVRTTFHEICDRLGIGRTLAGTRPRIHDLRHRFAVAALERCPRGRAQINRHTLALTTYLGHAKVESTYWYLERTPQLLRGIATACERFLQGGAS
jgi:integrase/recombinase XerD